MELNKITGPGVSKWLISQLQLWGIEALTDIQVRALSAGVANQESMIVCAPTSSGKTLVGEIAVLCGLKSGKKAIYLVSHKALADQKFDDFQRRFGEDAAEPLGSVGLSTGDREEGDYSSQLMVATYEKALGLILANQLDARHAIIVADELQILGEPGRGPNIEALCAVLRQRGFGQFIVLTATVGNPEDLSGWLNSKLVISHHRDIELNQEIWCQDEIYRIRFGQTEGVKISERGLPNSTAEAVNYLIQTDRSPVLVFTETRREASDLASSYSQNRDRVADGIFMAEQLDLFSEPTETSEQLKINAEKKVAFHNADLTSQERRVIEQGFIDSRFEVCFATSTLAAGVNFPFKSVIFAKLTYGYGDRAGKQISLMDYRNMSGRAGRLGLHDKGYSILLPRNKLELQYANKIVLPENENINSQLVSISMRRTILMLVASGIIDSREVVKGFFENTLYWFQTQEKNPSKLDTIIETANFAIDWLLEKGFIEKHEEHLIPTPLGKATSVTGLLPSTAYTFVLLIKSNLKELENQFEEYITAILYWICSSDEFKGDSPSRFLVYPIGQSSGSASFLINKKTLVAVDRADTQLCQCVHALTLYVDGESEPRIRRFTNIPSGGLHRLAIDVGWVLDGLHRLACVADVGCSQHLSNKFSMLSRRVHWGAPAEILDIIRVAEKHRVPGFGRQRAMALIENGLSTFDDILNSAKEKLSRILRNDHRTNSLLVAVQNTLGLGHEKFTKSHQRVAAQLGVEDLIAACEVSLGTEYETAIAKILEREKSWKVTILDNGRRQNVPDIMLSLDGVTLLIECKTCMKKTGLIKREEAFSVLQKAVDYGREMRRITLGKPGFDEHSKLKAQGSSEITLVEHAVFLEGILRLCSSSITPKDFFYWLAAPGVTEVNRLLGDPTYLHK